MILADLKKLLQKNGAASLLELTQRLDCEPDAIRGMLGILIRKGKVRKSPQPPGCATKCSKCDPLMTEIYEYLVS